MLSCFLGGKDRGGLDLLTALLHTAVRERRTLAAAVPPLSTHFISSNTVFRPTPAGAPSGLTGAPRVALR